MIEFQHLLKYTGNGVMDSTPYSDIRPFGLLFSGLVIATHAQLVVEIGTGVLNSTKFWSYGLQFNGGLLHTCDPAKQFKDIDLPLNASYHQMTSDEFLSKCPRNIDILYIDGDHEEGQVRKDYENFAPLVKPGGLIVFHDYTHPNAAVRAGIQRIVGSIAADKLIFRKFPGLVIVQKEVGQ